jgi:hypothetical protein
MGKTFSFPPSSYSGYGKSLPQNDRHVMISKFEVRMAKIRIAE